MNYTENHHLPQWVESDRVLMNDFNDAMRNIENALTQGDRTQTASGIICRDVYRQEVQLRLHHGLGGVQESMWINPLLSSADAGGDGHGWTGKYGVWQGSGINATLDGIKKTVKEEVYVNIGNSGVQSRAITSFTSNGHGVLEQLTFWFVRYSTSPEGSAPFTVRLVRRDTGKAVTEARVFTHDQGTYLTEQVNFPLEPAIPYQLELDMTKETFHGRAGFMLGTTQFTNPSIIHATVGTRDMLNTIEKTVAVPAGTQGILGLVRWQGSGTVRLTVGGREGTATKVKNGVNAQGAACKETEFSFKDVPAGQNSVVLRLERGTGDLKVFDYGLIWR